MDYSKFYTPPVIAELLVKQLHIEEPREVVDICCGSCNLLHAAYKKWPQSVLLGVDLVNHEGEGIEFVQMDGRRYALEHEACYSLVLANPPFDFLCEKNEFPELYDALPEKYSTSRLEIEMLLANLQMLEEGGSLMIIMPSTFVDGEIYIKMRKYIGKTYFLHKVIRLPDETFGQSRVRTCALLIEKNERRGRKTFCYTVEFDGEKCNLKKECILPKSLVDVGDWNVVKKVNVQESLLNISRGKLSSACFEKNGIPVLHTAKIQEQWVPSVRYVNKKSLCQTQVYAETGDVLVCRIGKAAGSWTCYAGPRVLISDCLFCVKGDGGTVVERIGNHQYDRTLRGLTTRYITKTDFIAWYENL